MNEWITEIADSLGYWGIALLMFLENIFPPIPSEVVMPSSGFAAQQGELSFAGAVAAGSAGTLLGVIPWYFLGRWLGKERALRWTAKYGKWLTIQVDELERSIKWFDRRGKITVLVCRLIPGLRTLISVPAGIAGMRFVQFLVYSAIGTVGWTALLTWLGWLLRDNYESIGKYVTWIAAGVLAAIFSWWVFRFVRRRAWSQDQRRENGSE